MNPRSVKAGHVPRVETNRLSSVTQLVTELSVDVNATHVGVMTPEVNVTELGSNKDNTERETFAPAMGCCSFNA